jgi:hypothetical protein
MLLSVMLTITARSNELKIIPAKLYILKAFETDADHTALEDVQSYPTFSCSHANSVRNILILLERGVGQNNVLNSQYINPEIY